MATLSDLQMEAARKGLSGPAAAKFVYGTLNKLKEAKEKGQEDMVNIAPSVSTVPVAPGLGSPTRRGVLTSRPVVMKSPSIFGGPKLSLSRMMQGVRPGGIRKLAATRNHLGSVA